MNKNEKSRIEEIATKAGRKIIDRVSASFTEEDELIMKEIFEKALEKITTYIHTEYSTVFDTLDPTVKNTVLRAVKNARK